MFYSIQDTSVQTHRSKKLHLLVFGWSHPQLERYNELKERSLKHSAILSQQAEKLTWELKADHEQNALDQRRKKEVEVLQVALLSPQIR